MVETEGDIVKPSELVVPVFNGIAGEVTPTVSGAMWVSGAKLYYYAVSGGTTEL